MKITRWLSPGFLRHLDAMERMQDLGDIYDEACLPEEEAVFQADNGKFYQASVQLVIEEADPDMVKDLLQDLEDDGE